MSEPVDRRINRGGRAIMEPLRNLSPAKVRRMQAARKHCMECDHRNGCQDFCEKHKQHIHEIKSCPRWQEVS